MLFIDEWYCGGATSAEEQRVEVTFALSLSPFWIPLVTHFAAAYVALTD